jgi:trimeric autotransporter adhesin
MKTINKFTFVALLLYSCYGLSQVGINTTTPEAQLDIRSANQAAPSNTDGLLIPKVDAFPAVNPGAAQQGMLVYLTTAIGTKAAGFYYWDNTSTSWVGISGKAGWETTGNTGTTTATNFLGTTDNQGLAVRTNNLERMRIDNNGFVGIGTTAPENKVHIVDVPTGVTPNVNSTMVIENNSFSYLSILSGLESGVIFGTATDATSGSITYNNPFFLNGMSFRTNGNVTRMNLADNGNLALGAFVPQYPLHFPSTNGDKISLWGGAGAHTGFGIQTSLFQMYTGSNSDDIAFGYGESSAFTENVRIKGNGKVGIGTATPQSKLHIYSGASGLTPNASSPAVIEGTGFTYVNVLSNSETGIVFGSNGNGTNGGVVYNSGIYANGMNFRTGGNMNRMNISSAGNVSIGDVIADARLHINPSNAATPANNDGLIIPRISAFPAVNPAVAQNGMMVYLTTTASGKVPGFYYWENASTSWKGVGSSTGWGLNGNSGTSAVTNFMGTTDNQDVVFKRNNSIAGRLGASNTSFGANAMASINGGLDNIAIGLNALTTNATSNYNVAIGANALYYNTASGIVGIGQNALAENSSGQYNTAIGTGAAQHNATTSFVTSVGYNALNNNNASYNTAVGVNALLNNQGEWNVAIGVETMKTNSTGLANTAIGDRAMFDNTDGQQNTAVGHQALFNNETGDYNTTVGINSLFTNQSGVSNTALGTGAMYWHATGDANTAIGMQAMNNQTSGSYNTALGVNANLPDVTGSHQLSIANVIYGTGMNSTASAKIGIADSAPDAKLEITASNSVAPANTDGILIPRVSTFPITNPTSAQNGMMIYLTTQVGVYQTGFYYWDNTAVSWLPVGSKTNWNTFGNAGTNPTTSFIGSTDNVGVALRSNNTERIRIAATGEVGIGTNAPSADLEVNGYTKLGGSTAPAIKVIKLTGTTASTMGGSVAIASGVTGSKVLEVSAMVEYTSGAFVPMAYNANTGYEYHCYVNGSSIVVINKSANSANVLSKPIKLMVTYEE